MKKDQGNVGRGGSKQSKGVMSMEQLKMLTAARKKVTTQVTDGSVNSIASYETSNPQELKAAGITTVLRNTKDVKEIQDLSTLNLNAHSRLRSAGSTSTSSTSPVSSAPDSTVDSSLSFVYGDLSSQNLILASDQDVVDLNKNESINDQYLQNIEKSKSFSNVSRDTKSRSQIRDSFTLWTNSRKQSFVFKTQNLLFRSEAHKDSLNEKEKTVLSSHINNISDKGTDKNDIPSPKGIRKSVMSRVFGEVLDKNGDDISDKGTDKNDIPTPKGIRKSVISRVDKSSGSSLTRNDCISPLGYNKTRKSEFPSIDSNNEKFISPMKSKQAKINELDRVQNDREDSVSPSPRESSHSFDSTSSDRLANIGGPRRNSNKSFESLLPIQSPGTTSRRGSYQSVSFSQNDSEESASVSRRGSFQSIDSVSSDRLAHIGGQRTNSNKFPIQPSGGSTSRRGSYQSVDSNNSQRRLVDEVIESLLKE